MTVRWTVRAAEDRARSSREKESLEVHQKIRTRKCADFYFFTFNSSLFTNSACTDFLESNR